MSLSKYQKAILQAMDIPLFERSSCDLEHSQPQSNKLNDGTLSHIAEIDAAEKSTHAKHMESISAVLSVDTPINSASSNSQAIDENHALVVQVLDIFGVKNLSELGVSWRVDDKQSVVLKDGVLISAHPDKLNTPELKKQLWLAIQELFKAELWS